MHHFIIDNSLVAKNFSPFKKSVENLVEAVKTYYEVCDSNLDLADILPKKYEAKGCE